MGKNDSFNRPKSVDTCDSLQEAPTNNQVGHAYPPPRSLISRTGLLIPLQFQDSRGNSRCFSERKFDETGPPSHTQKTLDRIALFHSSGNAWVLPYSQKASPEVEAN